MPGSRSLVHYVNAHELEIAQKLYLPYAEQGKKFFSITDAHVRDFAPVLAATSGQYLEHELISQLTRLQNNSESENYYRKEFVRIAQTQCENEPRIDDQYVMDELISMADASPLQIEGIIKHLLQKFKLRCKEALQLMDTLKTKISSQKTSPENLFSGARRELEGVYRGDYAPVAEYFFAMARVGQWVAKREKKYRQYLKEHENRETLTVGDMEPLIKEFKRVVINEFNNFKKRMGEITKEYSAFYKEHNDIDQLKISINNLVENCRGEFIDDIKAAVRRAIYEYKGNDRRELFDRVRVVVRETVKEGYRNKTERDRSKLFKKEEAEKVKNWSDEGSVSEGLIDFLSLYLNSDFLAKANAYHTQYCDDVLSRGSKVETSYHLDRDSDNPKIVYLRIATQYYSTQADDKYFGSEVARTETILKIEENEAVTVSIDKSETHIYSDDLRQKFFLNHLKKRGGIADKASRAQFLNANDQLVVDSYLRSRPWSDRWKNQLNILGAMDDLDELFWRARSDQAFFRQLFHCERTSHSANNQHLWVLQKFCQMPDVLNRLDALTSHYEASKVELGAAFKGIRHLKFYLQLVNNQNWSQIAEFLNDSKSRDLMMCALHSLQDVQAIKTALSYSGIVYALDANTLNHFALKDESIARIVLRQSFIQRLWVKFQVAIFGEVYWQVPVTRLQGEHISQLWQRYFKPLKDLFRHLLRNLDLKRDIFTLSKAPSVELRQATSQAIFSDTVLARKVLKTPLDSVQAANARLSLVSDLGLDVSYQDRSLAIWSNYFQFGIAEPRGQGRGQYCIADDKTVEDHYVKYFLALISKNTEKNIANKFHRLQKQIVQLWSGKMKLPQRQGIDALAKKAMMRVIREQKVPVVLKKLPLSFYRDIFEDPMILKNFIEDSASLASVKAMTDLELRNQLRLLMLELVRKQPNIFKLEHLCAVSTLFSTEKDEIYRFPDLCLEAVQNVLHHYTNIRLMSGFPIDEVDEEKVSKLLKHADPMDLLEFLLRKSGVDKEIELINKITQKEQKIKDNTAEIKRLRKIKADNRRYRTRANTKQLNDDIRALTDENNTLIEKLKIPRNTLAFFSHASRLIRTNHNGFLEKIPAELLLPALIENPDLITEKTLKSLPQGLQDRLGSLKPEKRKLSLRKDTVDVPELRNYLLLACTNLELRKRIWSDPALQQHLSHNVDCQTVLTFFRATNFNELKNPSRVVSCWADIWLQLLDPKNEALLNQHWQYLLENVPDFARKVMYLITHNKGFRLGGNKIDDLTHYVVVGSDLLILLEQEYQDGEFVLRKSLLDNPEILSRALKIQHNAQNCRGLANRMVKVLGHEIRQYELDKNPKSLNLIDCLLSDNQIEFMVNNADSDKLNNLIDLIKIPRRPQPLPNGIRRTLIQSLIRTYLITEPRRIEMKKSPDLVAALLIHSTNEELLQLIAVDPDCFEILLRDQDIMNRYKEIHEGAIEQLYLYLQKKLSDDSTNYLPKIIGNLKSEIPLPILVQVLPTLINHVTLLSRQLPDDVAHTRDDQREQVYQALQTPEVSLKLRSANSEALFELFIQTKDLRAIRLLFFKHPSLRSHLMLQCWLDLSPVQLIKMLNHQFDEARVPGLKNNLAESMIRVLVDNIASTTTQRRFLILAGNEACLQEILNRMTLPQLKTLMASNKEIADVIVAHFSKPEYRKDFIALLKRGTPGTNTGQLLELHSLLSEQPALTCLLIDCVKNDYNSLSTQTFDSVIIDFIRSDQDHQTAFKILDLCYQEEGGVFFKNFSVPLNSSKTRIFFLYHLSGGLAMSTLYNHKIRFLRKYWKELKKQYDPNDQPRDFLAQLENADKAGDWLSFDQLIKDQNRVADQTLSRTEEVLYLLYAFSRCLKLHHKDFLKTEYSSANTIKKDLALFRLFEAVVKSESRVLKPIDQACTPMELASLVDADDFLDEDTLPMQNWLFNEHEDQPMPKLMGDADAFCALMESPTFQLAFQQNAVLYTRVKAYYKRFKSGFVQNNREKPTEDNSCYFAVNDNGTCTESELRAILTAREYYDRGRELHRDTGTVLRDLSGARALFTYANGEFRIAGYDHQLHTHNKLMSVKYLSRYFYARYLHRRKDFLEKIRTDSKYRAAFCQGFKFEWSTEVPPPHLRQTHKASCYDPNKESSELLRYPRVTLSLTGLEPEDDLLLMYCVAAKMDCVDQNHRRALAAIAVDHKKPSEPVKNAALISKQRDVLKRNQYSDELLSFSPSPFDDRPSSPVPQEVF